MPQQELVELSAELAAHRREGTPQHDCLRRMRTIRREIETMPLNRRAAPVLVAAFEPVVVRDVMLGLWSGVTVSLGSACSSAVRTVGIGLPLGDLVANFATGALGKLEPVLRKGLSVLPAEVRERNACPHSHARFKIGLALYTIGLLRQITT